MNIQEETEKIPDTSERKLVRYIFWANRIAHGLDNITVTAFLKSEGFNSMADFVQAMLKLEEELEVK